MTQSFLPHSYSWECSAIIPFIFIPWMFNVKMMAVDGLTTFSAQIFVVVIAFI